MKIFIASPAFDGKVHIQYAVALAQTALVCAANNISMEYKITPSGSLLCAERNRLVQDFLESNCTHMLCVDSDLGWPAQCIIAMLSKDLPFIAGVYPARIGNGMDKSFLFRPVYKEDGTLVVNQEKGVIKMEYIPAGFMLLKREVFEKMIETHSHTKFVPKDQKSPSGYALFNTEIWDGEFWGEDFVFCRRAREAGFDIWVDPLIQFDHSGKIGMLCEVLSRNNSANVQAEKTIGE